MKLKFEHDGKRYESDPAAHVRLPDGVTLKVIKSDSEGSAEVAVSKKTVPDAPEAMEIPQSMTVTPEATVKAKLAELKEEWERRAVQIKVAKEEQVGFEIGIAEQLLLLPRKRDDGPAAISLGGVRHKAQKSRGGGRPSLVPVPVVRDIG